MEAELAGDKDKADTSLEAVGSLMTTTRSKGLTSVCANPIQSLRDARS